MYIRQDYFVILTMFIQCKKIKNKKKPPEERPPESELHLNSLIKLSSYIKVFEMCSLMCMQSAFTI